MQLWRLWPGRIGRTLAGTAVVALTMAGSYAAGTGPAVPTVTTGPAPTTSAPLPAIAHPYHIILGLKDGYRYIGDVMATISPDGTVALDCIQALNLLKPVLNGESYEALSRALAGQKEAGAREYAVVGIKLHYDSAQLQVVLDIPPIVRRTQNINVADLDRVIIGEVAKPAKFSGYLNLRGSVDYIERGGETGIQEPLVLLDGAVRYAGTVLESEGQFEPGRKGDKLNRQGTRLVFDDDSHIMRWTLGDLRVLTDGFQGSRDMAGLSVMRLYDQLSPQMNVRPRGNRSFTLTQASTVQTFVNGLQVQQVRLDPGSYNAGNFPFVEGANDVRLLITDDTGKTESLNFSIFFDRAMLRSGLTEFGLFAGVASDAVTPSISYPNPKPLFTGFVRHGFSDYLMAGANVQADSKVQMGGFTGLWGSPLGTIGFDLAGSRNIYAGEGYAINLGFNRLYQDTGNFESQTISATFEMRSSNFSIISSADNAPVLDTSRLSPKNPYLFEAAVSYGRSFGQYTYVQLDCRYAKGRDGKEDVGTIRSGAGYAMTADTNFNVSVQYATGGFQQGWSAGIQLTYRFNDHSNSRAEYETQNNMRRLNYQTSVGRGTGAWNVSGDLESTPGAANFNGSADYTFNRAQAGAAQTVTYDAHGNSVKDVRTSMHAGTSVAFAENSVALGRPVFDSFALFEAHPTLGDSRIVVEPSPEGELARSDRLGPAFLSDLGSHSLRTIAYDVPAAPAGYDIGAGSFRAVPPYKSGYRIIVGSDYSLMVLGRLLDRKGEPVPLLAGRAVEQAPGGKTVTLFTSRDGRFVAQGLRPGHWRIEMPTIPPATYDLVIEEGPTGLVQVGDLKPERTE
jgi:outer membrane usher protein